MPARHVTVRVEAGTVRLHLPRATFDLSHNEGRALRDVLNRTLPEQITDLMHDPRVKDVDVLQAAQTMLAERGQDTESLSVAIAAIENPRCTLCGCGATGEAFGFPVCDYHVDHTEDDPQCPDCMTADEEQLADGRQLLRETREPVPVLTDSDGLHYCPACTEQTGAWGLHDEQPDPGDEWWCARCECGLTPAAWERETNGTQPQGERRVTWVSAAWINGRNATVASTGWYRMDAFEHDRRNEPKRVGAAQFTHYTDARSAGEKWTRNGEWDVSRAERVIDATPRVLGADS